MGRTFDGAYLAQRKEIDKMWFYRAIDEDGCYIGEAYRKADLMSKLIAEFGEERTRQFTIIRVLDKTLK